jgi:hypothetical protein
LSSKKMTSDRAEFFEQTSRHRINAIQTAIVFQVYADPRIR